MQHLKKRELEVKSLIAQIREKEEELEDASNVLKTIVVCMSTLLNFS